MRSSEAAVRYARALFEIAQERNTLADTDRELETLGGIVQSQPAVLALVLNSAVSRPQKEDFLSRILGSSTSGLLLNFLKVLIKKNQFQELVSIQREFRRFYQKKQGIRDVKVISAIPLSDANQDRIKTLLEKQWKTKIRMQPVLEPEIVGGLIIRFDNQQIDGSYRNRLQMLRQQLLA